MNVSKFAIKESPMDVSIVIRTKNEGEFIEETLEKVREQEFDGHYEIIVVDSGSTDSTLDIVRKHNVELLHIAQENFTYGRSLNIGASDAKGEFVVNLSAHALPKDNKWLTNLINGFEDPCVAGVYGRQLSNGRLNPFEALQNVLFFGQERITFNMENMRILKKIHFSNSNSAVRRDVWQRFKFNELALYAEDMLWQREVIDAGFSIVYVPDSVVYHTHRVRICSVYRCSRDCAYVLSMMKQKRQSIPMVLYDAGLFLGLVPGSILQNLRFMWRNNYGEHLKVTPLYVLSGSFGWLVGRIKYRLRK